MQAFLAGFFLSLSLILAIGAQNAYVLRQGLLGQHVLAVVLACAISDAVLIAAGVAGFGILMNQAPWIEPVFRYGGVAFLVVYGVRSLISAWRNTSGLDPAADAPPKLLPVLLTCLALTWLNPHVYLDTLVLLGSISTGFDDKAWVFGAGAVLASFCFFFALGFGAQLLRPLFAKPAAWRVLDVLVALVMFSIAAGLALGH